MTKTMDYAEATQAHDMTTEEIVHQSTLFMEAAARLLERGEIYFKYEPVPLTEFQINELLRMISLAGRNARVAYQYATRDYGGMYVALVGHQMKWTKGMADYFESMQRLISDTDKRTGSHLTPRDWSLHS